MKPGCPTDLALERHLLDPAAHPLAPHLDACTPCRERVARMEDEGRRFRQFVYPATVERVEAAARRRPRRFWLAVLAPVSALAAALVAVILLRPAAPPDDYLGVKGAGGVGLTAFVQGAGGSARPVAEGGAVAARAALRLRVRAAAPCRAFVLSIDGRGTVSRLDGGGAEGLSLPAGTHDLAGGIELDGAPGPERLFAVCAPDGAGWPAIEAAARAAAAGGTEGVRGAGALPLPSSAAQATLLLEKAP